LIKKGVPLIVNIKVESIVDEIEFSRIIAKLAHHSRLIMVGKKDGQPSFVFKFRVVP
jgi:hypothetical protein